MDYMRQFNAFGVQSAGILSSNAVNLYVRLFLLNNQHGWTEYFPATHSLLCMATGIGSNNTLKSVREELKKAGFIDFKDGGHKKPTLYKLIPLYVSNTDTKTDSKTDSKTDTKTDSKTDTIKDYKTKTKTERYTRAKFTPPSLAEIQSYVAEKGLSVSVERFFDYFTAGNWYDAKGNPVKNWKQKLLTWDKHEQGTHFDNKTTPSQQNTTPASRRPTQFTPEELKQMAELEAEYAKDGF